MDSYAKRRLELNDYAGISLNKSFHSLVAEEKGYDNLPFGEIRCRSYIAKFAFTRRYRNICMVIQVMVRMHEWTDTKSNNNISISINARSCGTDTQKFEDGWCKLVEKHVLKILFEKDVKEIHPHYILYRWRKDVKHRHYSMINCYKDLMSGENAKQFDHLCSNFYEAAHIANSDEKYEYLLSCVNMAKEKLNDDSVWGYSSNINLVVEDVHISDSTTKLLSPLQVRSKGHPPYKRKESRVEQVMKKKTKKNVHEKTDNIQQDQTDSSREHGTNSYNDEPKFDLNVSI
ncbi:unnamed protein product [Lactuca saligna]|uniref:Protein FAR1-RELATED SEQUENCE n=1 Tax=Lactuca saligna TaxID=75948 RepID=A0AA35VML2_LACSI|nr:unnamed protein product [Lactuca saligna]